MSCASSCLTQDHESYGQCLRAKGVSVMGLETTGNDFTKTKKMHAENAAYRAAVAEGLDPVAPTQAAVDAARKAADVAGAPVQMTHQKEK